MTKIFHIVSNKEWGGGEQYVYDLTQRQLADGINVEVFCRPVESVIGKFHQLGVPVNPLSLHGVLDIGSAWRMASVVRKAGPVTIHAHNFKDAYTALYARILSGHSNDVQVVMCRHLTRPGKNSMPYNWLYSRIDGICFCSEISKEVFLSTNPAIDKRKICVVHSSIVAPTEPVVPANVRGEMGLGADEVLAMFHGRLDPEKGIDVLIDAVERIREKPFRLVIIGRGSEEYTAHVRQLLSDRNLQQKVLLAGFRHPILPYVAAADIGLLASTVSECCPLSPLEYMSQGVPVVTTDNGGQREYVVDGGNGLMVPPGDAVALADAIGQLVDNEAMRCQMGEQARHDFNDHLNYNHFYKEIQHLYAINHQ